LVCDAVADADAYVDVVADADVDLAHFLDYFDAEYIVDRESKD